MSVLKLLGRTLHLRVEVGRVDVSYSSLQKQGINISELSQLFVKVLRPCKIRQLHIGRSLITVLEIISALGIYNRILMAIL